MRDAPEQTDTIASLQLRPERPVAGEGERSLAEACEGVGEADDVLPLVERADAEEARRARRRLGDREALAVDAARDDLDLAARLGQLRLELAAQVVGDADHRCRAPHDESGRRGDPRDRADVADVPPVRGDDERRATGERGDQPGGNEEVRVDHVGPARGVRPARESQVAELPARTRVEDGQLDLVAARLELVLDLRDERPEVRRVGPGVHLGDEQDAHGASVRGPRAMSSVYAVAALRTASTTKSERPSKSRSSSRPPPRRPTGRRSRATRRASSSPTARAVLTALRTPAGIEPPGPNCQAG